tara:strand:- start:3337 stop:3633 length:297 start_codon:yes stop_codon:yes gene_type:complete
MTDTMTDTIVKDKTMNKTYDMKTYMKTYMNNRYKSNPQQNNLIRQKNIQIKKANIQKDIINKYTDLNDIIDYGKAKFILDKIQNKEILKDLFELYLGK